MKLDSEKLTVTIKDLGGQQRASQVLIFRLPPVQVGGSYTVHGVYVDDVKILPEAGILVGVRGHAGEYVSVVSFPKDYIWYTVDVSELEFFTLEDYYETERSNVRQRVQVEKSLKAVYEAAKGGDYEDPGQQNLFGGKGYE